MDKGLMMMVVYDEAPVQQQARRIVNQTIGNNNPFKLRIKMPVFDGKLHIEDFLDYLTSLENFFECAHIPDSQKVKFVSYHLKGGATAWWNQEVNIRKLQELPQITSWPEMRQLMRSRFLPADYEQELYRSFMNCTQGKRTVTEYTDEFYRLSSRVNMVESENQRVSRYIEGLKDEIKDQMLLHPIWSMSEAVSMARKVEQQPRTMNKSHRSSNFHKVRLDSSQDVQKSTDSRKSTQRASKTTISDTAASEKKTTNPYVKQKGDVCFKCRKPGHRSHECPRRRAQAAVIGEVQDSEDEEKEVESGAESEEQEEEGNDSEDEVAVEFDDEVEGDIGARLFMLSKRANVSTMHLAQRNNLFQFIGAVHGLAIPVTMDCGSSENFISGVLARTLGLKLTPHPSPYRVGWIKKVDVTRVEQQCTVPLNLHADFTQNVVCDVVEMDMCEVILGRPWQYDADITYHGRKNLVKFIKKNRVITLKPLDLEEQIDLRANKIGTESEVMEVGKRLTAKVLAIEKPARSYSVGKIDVPMEESSEDEDPMEEFSEQEASSVGSCSDGE